MGRPESQMISPEVYKLISNSRFIPLFFERDEAGMEFRPHFLKSRQRAKTRGNLVVLVRDCATILLAYNPFPLSTSETTGILIGE
jgi:hypothetical protein